MCLQKDPWERYSCGRIKSLHRSRHQHCTEMSRAAIKKVWAMQPCQGTGFGLQVSSPRTTWPAIAGSLQGAECNSEMEVGIRNVSVTHLGERVMCFVTATDPSYNSSDLLDLPDTTFLPLSLCFRLLLPLDL